MLIPPTYLRLLDRREPAEPGPIAPHRPRIGGVPTTLVAAATGAASGGLTAWLVLINLG
jgi:hypothetical protein